MAAIERIELSMVDLPAREPAAGSEGFSSQETPILRLFDSDGAVGTGFACTQGTGGSSVVRLLHDHLAPMLVGRDADMVEDVWRTLLRHTRTTGPGAVTALALAAVDTALWDLRCRRAELPLYVLAGGAQEKVPVFAGAGGACRLATEELVELALEAREHGLKGVRVEIGGRTAAEDAARVTALRTALGPGCELMLEAGGRLSRDQALRRVRALEGLDPAWLGEPLAADDVAGHARLALATALPLAVGAGLHSLGQMRDYLVPGAAAVVRVDAVRIGGITPWLKVAHLAEAFGLVVAPHRLSELHVSLAAAVPNGAWVEQLPQLEEVALGGGAIQDGHALPPEEPGLGIEWNWQAVAARLVGGPVLVVD